MVEGRPNPGSATKGDYFVPWHVPFHRADAASALRSGSRSQQGADSCPHDGTIDREKGSIVFKRYYHLFDEGELDELICQISDLTVEASFYDKSNWCCIFRKAHRTLLKGNARQ